MADIETTEHQDDADETTGEEETTTAKNNSGADDDAEGDDADDNKGDDDKGDGDDTEDDDDDADKSKGDDKKSKKDTSKDDDEEPPTRKRTVDYIKERQAKKGKVADDKGKKDDDGESDDEDDIDEVDEKAIGKVVNKILKPIIEKETKAQDDKEFSDFLTANPDFKPFEAKARKYASHPSRKDVPIEEIFYGVAGKDLLRIGAKRGKIADDEARKTKASGGSQDAGGVKTAATMSKAELEAKQIEVRAKLADR